MSEELDQALKKIKELESKIEAVSTAATVLYQSNLWIELPWGAKQILGRFVSEETKEKWARGER